MITSAFYLGYTVRVLTSNRPIGFIFLSVGLRTKVTAWGLVGIEISLGLVLPP